MNKAEVSSLEFISIAELKLDKPKSVVEAELMKKTLDQLREAAIAGKSLQCLLADTSSLQSWWVAISQGMWQPFTHKPKRLLGIW